MKDETTSVFRYTSKWIPSYYLRREKFTVKLQSEHLNVRLT